MSDNLFKDLAVEVFAEAAEMLKTGESRKKVKVGLTTLGSEISSDELVRGAEIAMSKDAGLEVVIIGPAPEDCQLTVYEANDEDAVHEVLEGLLDSKELNGVVTMHYPFPIGVSTVGKVITPARGKSMYIATTTGTSDTDRIQGMVKNAVYGIAVAKADGIANPKIAILNVDGARQVERHLNSMKEKGYEFTWGESQRADGGHVLRGNDLITGSVDVVITDTLTGNILMKLFSSFNSGGSYETVGFGYGPGVGDKFGRLIHIVSRASGTPVIEGAIEYCAAMVRGGLDKLKQQEIKSAEKAGWIVPAAKPAEAAAEEEVAAPPAKVVDSQIPGIDILELEDAVKALWKKSIFASSGMGCTGPVILVAAEDKDKSLEILKESGYL